MKSEADDLSSDCGEVTGKRPSAYVDLLGSTGGEMERTHMQQVFPSPSVMPDTPLIAGGHDYSCHNTGSGHVQPAPLYPVWQDGPSGVNSGEHILVWMMHQKKRKYFMKITNLNKVLKDDFKRMCFDGTLQGLNPPSVQAR